VLNGLKALESDAGKDDWVLVHDAARPCLTRADLDKMILTLEDHPVGGILALPVRDTMKRGDSHLNITETVDRKGLWHALTPQMFRYSLLMSAIEEALTKSILVTDEAQAVELTGRQPLLIEGSAENIKITRQADLELADLYLYQAEKEL
jgi:2-C-methyl-D-erythritol 4-phosphate cytidylyltransferase